MKELRLPEHPFLSLSDIFRRVFVRIPSCKLAICPRVIHLRMDGVLRNTLRESGEI